MDKSETQKLTADLYVKYGTTMAGLVVSTQRTT